MLLIKNLSDMIEEELHDADKYIECALKHKDGDRTLADAFYTLSGEELKHVDILHAQVVRIINDYKHDNGEPPVAMQAVYDYLHERFIEYQAKIVAKRAFYKG